MMEAGNLKPVWTEAGHRQAMEHEDESKDERIKQKLGSAFCQENKTHEKENPSECKEENWNSKELELDIPSKDLSQNLKAPLASALEETDTVHNLKLIQEKYKLTVPHDPTIFQGSENKMDSDYCTIVSSHESSVEASVCTAVTLSSNPLYSQDLRTATNEESVNHFDIEGFIREACQQTEEEDWGSFSSATDDQDEQVRFFDGYQHPVRISSRYCGVGAKSLKSNFLKRNETLSSPCIDVYSDSDLKDCFGIPAFRSCLRKKEIKWWRSPVTRPRKHQDGKLIGNTMRKRRSLRPRSWLIDEFLLSDSSTSDNDDGYSCQKNMCARRTSDNDDGYSCQKNRSAIRTSDNDDGYSCQKNRSARRTSDNDDGYSCQKNMCARRTSDNDDGYSCQKNRSAIRTSDNDDGYSCQKNRSARRTSDNDDGYSCQKNRSARRTSDKDDGYSCQKNRSSRRTSDKDDGYSCQKNRSARTSDNDDGYSCQKNRSARRTSDNDDGYSCQKNRSARRTSDKDDGYSCQKNRSARRTSDKDDGYSCQKNRSARRTSDKDDGYSCQKNRNSTRTDDEFENRLVTRYSFTRSNNNSTSRETDIASRQTESNKQDDDVHHQWKGHGQQEDDVHHQWKGQGQQDDDVHHQWKGHGQQEDDVHHQWNGHGQQEDDVHHQWKGHGQQEDDVHHQWKGHGQQEENEQRNASEQHVHTENCNISTPSATDPETERNGQTMSVSPFFSIVGLQSDPEPGTVVCSEPLELAETQIGAPDNRDNEVKFTDTEWRKTDQNLVITDTRDEKFTTEKYERSFSGNEDCTDPACSAASYQKSSVKSQLIASKEEIASIGTKVDLVDITTDQGLFSAEEVKSSSTGLTCLVEEIGVNDQDDIPEDDLQEQDRPLPSSGLTCLVEEIWVNHQDDIPEDDLQQERPLPSTGLTYLTEEIEVNHQNDISEDDLQEQDRPPPAPADSEHSTSKLSRPQRPPGSDLQIADVVRLRTFRRRGARGPDNVITDILPTRLPETYLQDDCAPVVDMHGLEIALHCSVDSESRAITREIQRVHQLCPRRDRNETEYVAGHQDALEELRELFRRNLSETSLGLCVSCDTRHADSVTLNCQHCVVCQRCARHVRFCPLCYADVLCFIRIY